jgi:class 3 adenylate cyclase
MTAAAPSGVVTFLFTDVEGSTRRWEKDADEMRLALTAHDEVLRSAIETHGGFMFKHTGDGVCAAFASPKSAVDAAVAAQRALELPVRMGLATGEAELREGDYFGAVLNRVARVMAAGHGGQILLAESTAGLSAASIWWIWGRGGCGICRPRSGCSRYEQQGYARSSRPCGRSIRRRETCVRRPRA